MSGIFVLIHFGKDVIEPDSHNGWLMAGLLLLMVVLVPLPAASRSGGGLKSYLFFLRIGFSFLLFLVFLFTFLRIL